MPTVIVTADVEDAAKWEKGFRTHGKLFKSQTVKRVEFATNGENQVACSFKVKNLKKYMKEMESDATAEAMDFDGIKRDTVKIFVLDKKFKP